MKVKLKQKTSERMIDMGLLLVIASLTLGCGLISKSDDLGKKTDFIDESTSGISASDLGSGSDDATADGSDDDAQLSDVVDKLTSEIEQIKQQITLLQQEDEAINSRIDSLEAELQGFKDEMASAIQSLKDKDAELEKALADLETRINERITSEITLLNQEIAALKSEDAAIKLAMDQLEKDLKDYTDGKISDLDTKLTNALETVRQALEDKINTEIEDLQKQIDANRAEMLAEVSRLDSAISATNATLSELQAELSANTSADWISRIAIATTILEGYAQEADTLGLPREDSGIVATQNRIDNFDYNTDPDPTAEFQGILADITAVKVAVQTAAEVYKTNQEQQLVNSQATLQSQIDEIRASHEARVAEVDAKFAAVDDKFMSMQLQIEAINEQLNQLTLITERLNSLESHADSLQTAVDSINDNFNQDLLDQIAANTSAIKMNKVAIDTLTASISAINGVISKIQDDVLGLKIGQGELDMLQGVLQSFVEDTGAIFLEFRKNQGLHQDIGAKIAWITEISVRYQASSTHYQLGIAELIALFRSKELQNGGIADAITAIETDFTNYIAIDLKNREEIRAMMAEYTSEISKLRADIDNLQAAHDALARDAIKRDEFDAAITELKASDAKLAADIEQALADAKAYTDQAIEAFKLEVASMFESMGVEVQQTVAAIAANIADLRVKIKSLEERHESLEGRLDGQSLSQEKLTELKNKRQRAEAAYDLFLRALFELEDRVVRVWDPAQGEANWADYLLDFKASVMDPRASDPLACGIEFGASFPNSIGLDAQKILAMEFVNKLWQANDPSGILQSIAGQTTMLNRYPAGEASDPNCLTEAMAWAEVAYDKDFHTTKGGDLKLKTALAGDPEYRSLEARFINTITAYAADWKAYQDIIAEVQGADAEALKDLIAEIVVGLQEGLATKAELETLRAQLQLQIDSMQTAIGALQVRDDAFANELQGIKDLIASLDADYKTADANLQAQIDAIPDPSVPAGVSKGMAELISIVSEIAKRSGYSDLALEASQLGTSLLADLYDENKYYLTPQFTECQHFFTDAYDEFASKGWSKYFKVHGNATFCDSNTIEFGDGAAQHRWESRHGKCSVNFRNKHLKKHHNTAVANVMYRCLGSAQLALGTSNNGQKIIVPLTDADDLGFQASNKIAGFSEAKVVATDKIVVHGSNFAGVFDFYPTELLLRPYKAKYRSSYDINTQLTPVAYDITGQKDIGQGITTYDYNFRLGEPVRHRVELYSPIVLDFISVDRKVRTLQHANGVRFDLDANGHAERTGWVDGLDGAFLALDLNKNGRIDNGSELFGQSTRLKNGQNAEHGYAALAHYDQNQDGMVDKKDSIFEELVVWFDKNVDGISQTHEIYSLSDKGITSLSVAFTSLEGSSGFDKGNLVKYKAKFFGPASCPKDGCNSFDVFFGASVELSSK